jgi:HD-like signal output (HDOD) protein
MLRQLPAAEYEQLSKNLVIPPRPTMLEAIKRAQNAAEPNFDEIAEFINSDLTLSLAMIKAVNSPFYQLTQKINSVDQALQLLGLRNVCNLVEGIVLRQTLSAEHNHRMEQFWESAIRTAMIAGQIAQMVHGISPEEAYTFGLFRSSGKAVMAARFDSYLNTLEKGERYSRSEFIALEDRRYQTNHTVVGYLLSRTWYLPEDMQLAILNHHDFEIFEHRDEAQWHHVCTLIAIAGLAEHILKMHIQQFEHIEWRAIEPILLEHLALKLEEYEDLIDDISTRL